MKITTYHHLRDPRPAAEVETDWPGLVSALTTPRSRPGDKAHLGLWSPVDLAEGASRANANVRSVHALVLDYDGGHDWSTVLGTLAGMAAIWHTTYSSRPDDLRARIVVQISAPVEAQHWPAVAAWAMTRWRWADPACKDAGRAYYLPCADANGEFASGVVDGELVDVSHMRVRPRVKPRPVPGRTSLRHEETTQGYDPGWRMAQAEERGARVHGDSCKGALCPSCGDRSVWWAVEARTNPRAMCNHRNTCGWTGSIKEVPYGA